MNLNSFRLYIQHKWFIVKIPIFLVFLFFPFLIPNVFFIVWAWISLVMAGIFIIIQIVLLIDFAYDWDKNWHTKNIESEGWGIWEVLLIICAVVLIIISLGFYAAEIAVFGSGPSCHLNRFFILFSMTLGLVSIIGSLVLRRGLTPPAVICSYSAL